EDRWRERFEPFDELALRLERWHCRQRADLLEAAKQSPRSQRRSEPDEERGPVPCSNARDLERMRARASKMAPARTRVASPERRAARARAARDPNRQRLLGGLVNGERATVARLVLRGLEAAKLGAGGERHAREGLEIDGARRDRDAAPFAAIEVPSACPGDGLAKACDERSREVCGGKNGIEHGFRFLGSSRHESRRRSSGVSNAAMLRPVEAVEEAVDSQEAVSRKRDAIVLDAEESGLFKLLQGLGELLRNVDSVPLQEPLAISAPRLEREDELTAERLVEGEASCAPQRKPPAFDGGEVGVLPIEVLVVDAAEVAKRRLADREQVAAAPEVLDRVDEAPRRGILHGHVAAHDRVARGLERRERLVDPLSLRLPDRKS